MQNLSKYQGQIYVSSTTNRKINAFGHALNTQSYLIDEALMKGYCTLLEIKNYMKQHPVLDQARRNPKDERALDEKVISHLRWLAGEDKDQGFRKRLNNVDKYSSAEAHAIYNEVTATIRPIFFQVRK
jgi:hypothetical protein